MTDPIADMLTRIKNAYMAGHRQVEVPHSRIKLAIAELLVEHKYVDAVEVEQKSPQSSLQITLRYVGKTPAMTDVKRMSKPGRRMYSSTKRIPQSLGGYGLTIVSTSQGILSNSDARKKNAGGEVICKVW